MRKIDSIVIHHTATKYDTVDTIRRYHTEIKGWDDIGYHYVIGLDGIVKDGRPISIKGAHCIDKNRTSVGICMVGIDTFTTAQFGGLHRVLDFLCSTYKIPKKKIYGHNQFSNKKCPGFDIGIIRELL